MDPKSERPRVAVIKVGGSLLWEARDYREIAERLRPWLGRGAWVVVSAAGGVTDALERLARDHRMGAVPGILEGHSRLAGAPLPASLRDELTGAVRESSAATIVSWGERASATALQVRLSALGARVPVVELPARGLPPRRAAALVPGFYLRDARGRVRLLPRGGSDISAVLLANRLDASDVRLWKREGGFRGIPDVASVAGEIDGLDLLERLGDTIRPLHPAALRLALRWGIELTMEDPAGRHPSTRVLTHAPSANGIRFVESALGERVLGAAPALESERR